MPDHFAQRRRRGAMAAPGIDVYQSYFLSQGLILSPSSANRGDGYTRFRPGDSRSEQVVLEEVT
jgi:hypothetical protein